MKVYLIIGKNIDLSSFEFEGDSIKIGIDRGAFLSLENEIKLDYAIGDFDSCSSSEKDEILHNVPNVFKLNPIKDDTDTKHAYEMFKKQDDISFVILGGTQGKRIEHFYANLELVMKDKRIQMLDDNSLIFKAEKSFDIYKSQYRYYSFFPIKNTAVLSLSGFKYDVEESSIEIGQGLTISNELKGDKGRVEIIHGPLLCVFSCNDNAV